MVLTDKLSAGHLSVSLSLLFFHPSFFSLEGQTRRKMGTLVSLSEQQLVDCSWKYRNCGGFEGWKNTAFECIKDNNGIDTQESYLYEARVNRK